MPTSEYSTHSHHSHHHRRSNSPEPRHRYYVSYGSARPLLVRRRAVLTPLYILEEERKPRAGWSKETDDEYCRRKDRYYEMLVVDLEQKKKEKAKVRELMETARDAHDLRKWKSEYGRLKDEVKVQERKLDDAKKSVLRRNRL
ncbi:hypothetical protein LTR37_011933 [Vermiconidia calcicola]|uniref:Uncharacterized protein n=1 Tax=Vermiconidia calcicola TaxID=1690605 RepID=A0ACC3N3L3_9PEZI|nr:hypothetical protein LTR37_011933 [Vermiconidia calcicola]